jgi:hypothetical protein
MQINAQHYEKWLDYFRPHLEYPFTNIIPQDENKRYDFKKFCRLMYKKSSRFIPNF